MGDRRSMDNTPIRSLFPALAFIANLTLTGCNEQGPSGQDSATLSPASMEAIGSISERFLAYNVEMVEVTGGRFWAPYADGKPVQGENRYEYRPPIDLTDSRLIKLAAALAPSYVRFSGTWANATHFADTEKPPSEAPPGFDATLTREQWRKAVEFSRKADAGIVLSFATSAGARDANGVWQADNAEQLMTFTRNLDAKVAAAEFSNEPNMIGLTQPPAGYTPTDYQRDYAIFYRWLRMSSPDTLVLAPGAVEMGEPMRTMAYLFGGDTFEPDQLMAEDSPQPDVFSFHYYGASSQRCHIPLLGSYPSDAFDPDWLAGIDDGISRSRELRDRMAPDAPLWITESGETACGGNPWATTFSDTFRFLDQLARSAQQGVKVFMHNTLAASDYALLDEHSFTPRPNYWAAWLWRNLMGSTVLYPGVETENSNVYAHCHRTLQGAVTVLAINIQQDTPKTLNIDSAGKIYTLTQAREGPQAAALNGKTLALGVGDTFPALEGEPVSAGEVTLEPASISFIEIPRSNNPDCQ